MKVELVPVRKIRLAAYNPRKDLKPGDPEYEAIKRSIGEFGFVEPLVWNKRTGNLVGGHQRLKVLIGEGRKEVEASVVDMDLEHEKALNVALNKVGGEFESKPLAEVLRDIAAANIDATLTGFTDKEIAALIKEAPSLKDADEIPDVQTKPRTKSGDLWLLGDHRLLCGDSFNAEDLKRLIEEKPVDLILTDPPYAIYGSSTGIGRDVADDKMVRPFFENLFRNCRAQVKEFGHVYVCCDWRSWAAIWDSARRADIIGKNCLVWDKGGGGLGANYANCYELIGFFARLPKSTTMTSTARKGQRQVNAPNILRYSRATGNDRQHNAAKPVALFEALINNSTEPGERVLDLFLGSGTTIIAAEKAGRAALGMEMEPKWCDVIVARWEIFTGKKATLAS